ncbi:unnamed protein product [Dicrocoelium dendriticum]|nr:unnamed protein product [Dicrocoelium dendriticum]CAI2737268.1 unnamed protein product [Dicrocoelium dendriticum]
MDESINLTLNARNYWTGGLGICHVNAALEASPLTNQTLDLTPQLSSFATFEASVASIVTLPCDCEHDCFQAAVGLDDGSVQLVTVPKNLETSSEPTLSINSSVDHDWPIQRLVTADITLVSLDTGGVVKIWDAHRFLPSASWSIGSSSWPLGGLSSYPDISVCPGASSPSFRLATLSPCDPIRQVALWDSRVSSLRAPVLSLFHLPGNSLADAPR